MKEGGCWVGRFLINRARSEFLHEPEIRVSHEILVMSAWLSGLPEQALVYALCTG